MRTGVMTAHTRVQARNQRWGNRAIAPPRNFHKRMYMLGATSYIILPPKKISVGCGPVRVGVQHQRQTVVI